MKKMTNPLEKDISNQTSEARLTPEQRTAELFSLPYSILAEKLIGMTLRRLLPGQEGKFADLILEELEPYARSENDRYPYNRTVLNAPAGELHIVPFPFRGTFLPLITARDEDAVEHNYQGACLLVRKALTEEGKELRTLREMVEHLGLAEIDTATSFPLQFGEEENILYVSSAEPESSEQAENVDEANVDEANESFLKFVTQ